MEDKSKSTHANQTYSNKGNISTSASSYNLQNGDWLCVMYECLGGGYLIGIDTRGASEVDLEPAPYQKTRQTKTICYRYDDAAPVHCLAMNTCKGEPLYVKERVTKSQKLSVSFKEWFDPIPNSGDGSRASSIESYRITLHETIPSKDKVQVDTGKVFTRITNANETSMTVQFHSTTPMLYCIVLEVKDVADNVKQARRFFLYDNSSHVELDQRNPLYVKSASASTNFTWQTHHNEICLSWEDHFLNKYYLNNQFLNPVETDRLGLISGVYDQIYGLLPVSGTENVHGIIKFEYFWTLNNGTLSNGTGVPNMTNQVFCKHFNLKDGQTYTFKILATDTANNQLEDETTVHIDRSVPHIKNIWLQKDDHRSFFVHDSKELSTMDLYFETLDPDSGILNVNWAFGTIDSGTELLSGTIRPDKLRENTCSSSQIQCYCPTVGKCQLSSYTIPLKNLVGTGSNLGNGSYFFSIKATNNALLSNIEYIEIFINASILEEVSETDESDSVGLVVGSVTGVGGFVFVIILILVVVLRIRRRKTNLTGNDTADIDKPETSDHGKSRPRQEDNVGMTFDDDKAVYSNIEWNPYEKINRSDTSHDYDSLRLPNEERLKHADNELYQCQARDSPSNPYEDLDLETCNVHEYGTLSLTEESRPSVAVYENLELRCLDRKAHNE